MKEGTSTDARCSTAWKANIAQVEVSHTISVVHRQKPLSPSNHCFSSCPTGGIERLCAMTGRRPEGLPHLQACDPITLKNAKSHGREISPWCSGRASEQLGMCKNRPIKLIVMIVRCTWTLTTGSHLMRSIVVLCVDTSDHTPLSVVV